MMDTQQRKWRQREREAQAEAVRRFGASPSPMAILQAIVDGTPGPGFVEYCDQMAIEYAARRCIDLHGDRWAGWLTGTVVPLRRPGP